MSLFRTKPLDKLLAQAESGGGLKRTLGAPGLIALGIGAVIGAGIFVRTAAAAGQNAGSGVIFSFIIAAIGCAFAGLCYAEFAAMIPIAGSAYTYAYVTMGELIAWVIGWALILEYALGSATLSIAWSEYLEQLFPGLVPWAWRHSPLQTSATGIHGIVNAPALVILFLLTLLLIKGTSESATVNAIIVAVKVTIVVVIIALGWKFISPANHTPMLIPDNFDAMHTGFFQHGWGGVIGGAGVVFFAFIGFDAVSTAAQETINPGRDMPIGILGSLAVCTVLYIAFSWVLTGIAQWKDFVDPTKGLEASVAYAIKVGMPGYGWLATAVTVAVLFGFSSVMLVMLLGQSRVFYSMANDGLLAEAVRRHPSEISHALQVQLDSVRVRGAAGRIPARRHHRKPDVYRDAVGVRGGVDRSVDHAAQESAPGAAVPRSAGAAGADPGRGGVPGDDRRTGWDHAAGGAGVDGDRAGGVLCVRQEPQPVE